MATQNTVQVKIVNGGSREDLRDSAGSKSDFRIPLHLELETLKESKRIKIGRENYTLPVDITLNVICHVEGFEREDGTGNSFIVKLAIKSINGIDIPYQRLNGYYHTADRKGFIHFPKAD